MIYNNLSSIDAKIFRGPWDEFYIRKYDHILQNKKNDFQRPVTRVFLVKHNIVKRIWYDMIHLLMEIPVWIKIGKDRLSALSTVPFILRSWKAGYVLLLPF